MKCFNIAKPISATPIFKVEDALAVLKEKASTQKDKEFIKEIRNQKIVLFSKYNKTS